MTDKARETKSEYLERMTKKAFNGEFVANLYTTGTPEYNELEDAISRGMKMRFNAYNVIQSQSARIAELEATVDKWFNKYNDENDRLIEAEKRIAELGAQLAKAVVDINRHHLPTAQHIHDQAIQNQTCGTHPRAANNQQENTK